MNTKLIINYTTEAGMKGQVIEYHTNQDGAYNAHASIVKKLGRNVKIDKVSFSPVLKHLELVVENVPEVRDTKYTEVK